MNKKFTAALLLVISFLLLSACSASLEEEQTAAKNTAEEAFNKTSEKTNHKNEDIEYYLPFGVEVKEESPNNIILKNGSKTYILFYNPHEGPDSKVVYDATIKQKKDYDVNETYTKDGHRGFLLINSDKKDENELIVGIGGVKISTQSKTKHLSSDAATMMEIVNSVKVTN
ncbi:hypothetical protein GCM10009865_36320 [Aeromicrobium ponti]|uniref:DUF4367 domain-containing protein n=1 Tax=Cytobacillus oceanisediminis TaxID=665099 RepID=A0A562JNG3_9BACI|nr:hypothetical protein [Cytobacillus oceanisediminis]TWH84464.1 hypothetical protein IQ19_03586 [Cytobacillus oceanisediminis]